MKLVYMGKYNGDENSLPCRDHMPGAVKFKEFDSMKQMVLYGNLLSFAILFVSIGGYWLRFGENFFEYFNQVFFAVILSLVTVFPHEILHALCFKYEVYLYTNWKQGIVFVTGLENMKKSQFIFMSLLPNIVFGLLPYLVALVNPSLFILGVWGALSVSMGAVDYINVFHAATQMPKGSKCYMHKINTYWYLPQ